MYDLLNCAICGNAAEVNCNSENLYRISCANHKCRYFSIGEYIPLKRAKENWDNLQKNTPKSEKIKVNKR